MEITPLNKVAKVRKTLTSPSFRVCHAAQTAAQTAALMEKLQNGFSTSVA